MTARLLLDEMYPPHLADLLRDKGNEVIAAAALPELVGSDDATVLDAATADDRCVITENIRDFAVLVRHSEHGGVLFVNGQRWPRTPAGIHRLATALGAAVTQGNIPGHNDIRWLD